MQNLLGNVVPVQSLKPQQVSGAVDGATIDTIGFEGRSIVVDFGAIGGSSTPTLTFKVQESDNGTVWADVAAADLLGGAGTLIANAANDDAVHVREYIGEARYLRVICSATSGTSPTVFASASILKHRARSIGTAA